jgi:hypothetical protein
MMDSYLTYIEQEKPLKSTKWRRVTQGSKKGLEAKNSDTIKIFVAKAADIVRIRCFICWSIL